MSSAVRSIHSANKRRQSDAKSQIASVLAANPGIDDRALKSPKDVGILAKIQSIAYRMGWAGHNMSKENRQTEEDASFEMQAQGIEGTGGSNESSRHDRVIITYDIWRTVEEEATMNKQ